MNFTFHTDFNIGDTIYIPMSYQDYKHPERHEIYGIIYYVTDSVTHVMYRVGNDAYDVEYNIDTYNCFKTEEECQAWCDEENKDL